MDEFFKISKKGGLEDTHWNECFYASAAAVEPDEPIVFQQNGIPTRLVDGGLDCPIAHFCRLQRWGITVVADDGLGFFPAQIEVTVYRNGVSTGILIGNFIPNGTVQATAAIFSPSPLYTSKRSEGTGTANYYSVSAIITGGFGGTFTDVQVRLSLGFQLI